MTGELTGDVELATQSRQVFFAARHIGVACPSQRFGQLVAKDADQDFE